MMTLKNINGYNIHERYLPCYAKHLESRFGVEIKKSSIDEDRCAIDLVLTKHYRTLGYAQLEICNFLWKYQNFPRGLMRTWILKAQSINDVIKYQKLPFWFARMSADGKYFAESVSKIKLFDTTGECPDPEFRYVRKNIEVFFYKIPEVLV